MNRHPARRLQPTPVWLGRLTMELRRLAPPLLAGHLEGLFSITFDIPLEPLPPPAASCRHWFYWERPERGEVLLGLGRALTLQARGEGRFASLGEQWRGLQANWTHLNQGSADPRVRAFTGFAFDPEAGDAAPWDGFPNATLQVPRLLLEWREGRCTLTFSHFRQPGGRPGTVIAEWLADLGRLLAHSRAAAGPVSGGPRTELELPSARAWQQQVARAVEAMALGTMKKVVLARELRLSFGQAVDHRELLARLGRDYPGCTLFGVRFGGATLVGATPERLLSLRRGEVVSDALAGTLERGGVRDLDAMVEHEHRPVVEAILSALAPHCSELEAGREPVSVPLQRLSHLYTRVRGRLASGSDLFDLMAALHPTPAVGGLPRRTALEWIRRREGLQRGWYTGALGWLGGSGEAELSVILRCGLLEGKQARLFAGAGITAVSDPAAELAETRLKLSALLDRLGP